MCMHSTCRNRSASDVSSEMWDGIKEFVCLDSCIDEPSLPKPFTFDDHVDAAAKFRLNLQEYCDRTVCAVCSRYRPKANISSHLLDNIPNLSLLDSTLPKTDELPRDALTTFQWRDSTYCLQAEGCDVHDDPAMCAADVCSECFSALKAKRVPPMSLVCFDAGKCKAARIVCS